MTKNSIIFLIIYLVNIIAVILLIGFVVESTLIKILLGLYLIVFSSVFSYVSRRKG